jgi:acetyl-CoA carboxylase biotin carboxyl carrier protein
VEGETALLTFEQIKELIELVGRHGLAGVEVERAGFRLKIAGLQAAAPAAPPAAVASPLVLAMPQGVEAALGGAAAAPPAAAIPAGGAGGAGAAGHPVAGPATGAGAAKLQVLHSPIVGTFYRAPSPEAPSFVEVGSKVRKGQVVCIIEAMKLMNEIESDVDGTIAEIFPQNAQAVEFQEPLFAIAPI